LRGSGVLDGINTHHWIGDKGYLDLGMITPIGTTAPRTRRLEKEFNTALNKIRWRIEQRSQS